MLVAASKLVPTLIEQTQLFRRIVELAYNTARMHMKLSVFGRVWPKCCKIAGESCRRRGVPFVVPGYESCLMMAGVSGRMVAIPVLTPPPPVMREPLPGDWRRSPSESRCWNCKTAWSARSPPD